MFKSEAQVTKIIKKVKKSPSLLSIHLNDTPIIDKKNKIWNYIVYKLNPRMF